MTLKPLTSPEFGDKLSISSHFETLELLNTRRSTLARNLTSPGPDREEIQTLIRLAARVPDHGKLCPWRFIIITGKSREKAGQKLRDIKKQNEADLDDSLLDLEYNRFLRAPVIITLISTAHPHVKIPEWEQVLSAGAACQNLLISAHAMGYGAQWLTEWYAYDPEFCQFLGVRPDEKIAGFLYIGQAETPVLERKRPNIQALTSYFE